MICPRCASPLSETAFGSTSVDGCGGCGGLWFDSNELNKLTRDPSVGLMEVERAFDRAIFSSGSGGEMECPRCAQALRKFSFPHTPDVTLDACTTCKGIWIDDGELAAIARRMAELRPAQPTPPVGPSVPSQARTVTGFLLSVPCGRCGAGNPVSCSVCWTCGAPLKAGAVSRLCPRCDTSLQERPCGPNAETRVDVCGLCGGVWLEAGEIAALHNLGLDSITDLQSCIVGQPHDRFADRGALRSARCPACHQAMEIQTYGSRRTVQADRCVNCRSLWLDSGELVAVVDLIRSGEFATTADRASDPWSDAE